MRSRESKHGSGLSDPPVNLDERRFVIVLMLMSMMGIRHTDIFVFFKLVNNCGGPDLVPR